MFRILSLPSAMISRIAASKSTYRGPQWRCPGLPLDHMVLYLRALNPKPLYKPRNCHRIVAVSLQFGCVVLLSYMLHAYSLICAVR
jgi:hypothetical protein